MSHSSKLMTLQSVASQLTSFIDTLSSDGITIEEYCSFFDIMQMVSNLERYLESDLTLELRTDERGLYRAVFQPRNTFEQLKTERSS